MSSATSSATPATPAGIAGISQSFFSDPRTMRFNQGFFLRDGEDRKLHLYPQWSYPSAYEANGKLHVVYSMVAQKESQSIRGAMMSIVDLNSGPAAAH